VSGGSEVEMRSPGAKPILCLLVLLAWPCLGRDGRAEAGFAPGVSTLSPTQSLSSLAEVETALGRESEANDMAPPKQEKNDRPVPGPVSPRDLLNLPGCAPGGMTSRGGGGPTGPSGGSVLPLLPTYTYQVPGADASGLLPPDDEGLDLPRLEFRLFRPPREN